MIEDFQKNVISKWESVLDDPNFVPVKDEDKRFVTAQIMENLNNFAGLAVQRMQMRGQNGPGSLLESYLMLEGTPTNVMGASSSVAGAGPIDIYDPVMIAMLRRTMPNLMSYDIMGVQPMTGPTGTVFALRGHYGAQSRTGNDLWYTEPNTNWSGTAAGNSSHTSSNSEFVAQVGTDPSLLYQNDASYTAGGGFNTTFAEQLGKDTGNEFQEISMTIDKINVQAMSRAMKATYSIEMAQDMMAIHGINAENQLTTFLTNTLLAEINREAIRKVYISATIGGQNCRTAGIFNMDIDADGRWIGEKILGLYLQIEFEANEIAKATRFGKGNLVVCTSNIASALNAAKMLKYSPEMVAKQLRVDDTGNTFVGVLNNGMKVFIDPYHQTSTNKHFVCVGYRGAQTWDAGMFYCPYIPLQYMKAVDPKSFQPALGFKTRYGMVANPFATSSADGVISVTKKNRYYRLFQVVNLL